MLGPEGAASLLRSALAGALPARLRILETRLGLEPLSLPDPARVLDHEVGPIALEDWPSVYVLPGKLTGIVPVDVFPGGGETYRCTYSLRVLVWVRASSYVNTATLRNRYGLAVREVLLDRKSLLTLDEVAELDHPPDQHIAPGSIREDYSPIIVDDAKRTIAATALDVDLIVTELLAPTALEGTADELDIDLKVDTAAIPPHPAL